MIAECFKSAGSLQYYRMAVESSVNETSPARDFQFRSLISASTACECGLGISLLSDFMQERSYLLL